MLKNNLKSKLSYKQIPVRMQKIIIAKQREKGENMHYTLLVSGWKKNGRKLENNEDHKPRPQEILII